MTPGKIQFAESEGTYVLKLIGEVRLTLCSSLEYFLQTVFEQPGFRSVIVDLSEAETIDSTSLGLLAKLSIMARKQIDQRPVLISPQPDITRILMSMGFERIFIIVEDVDNPTAEYQEIECEDCSEESTHARVLDAHRTLMSLNENNRKAFSDLVNHLERCRQSEATA
ncbi:STAS domain-containing protein [Endozoicomonas sp. SCSIO W0465]|uniref:STAS domain-containing protein n=1 Tax=Endozoicomonas sp. SCSIO W0465 TaxID=2918516 RepID=UPI0020760054|nr:STAS domain-containing protein [Endozoicomonas sp. SCSIO W0465]USE39554.1 STAS domain-containing protein [Endozoicomonas sp. SCSIO W0465]